MAGFRPWLPVLGLVAYAASIVVAVTHHLSGPAHLWWLGLTVVAPLIGGARGRSGGAASLVGFPVLAGSGLLVACFGQG